MNISQIRAKADDLCLNPNQGELDQLQRQWDAVRETVHPDYRPIIDDRLALAWAKVIRG